MVCHGRPLYHKKVFKRHKKIITELYVSEGKIILFLSIKRGMRGFYTMFIRRPFIFKDITYRIKNNMTSQSRTPMYSDLLIFGPVLYMNTCNRNKPLFSVG